MSMRVSYKKQFLFGIITLGLLLGVVEVFANVYLDYIYECQFETHSIYKDLNIETKKKICSDNINLRVIDGKIIQRDTSSFYINSEGFRGKEFSIIKPQDTVRIFLVGGSTTFGSGVLDDETISYYLQKSFEPLELKVEVINAGIPSAYSATETKLIKNKILKMNPDLIIAYTGYNDLTLQIVDDMRTNPPIWRDNWNELCKIKEENNFQIFVILQPMLGSGNKTLNAEESLIFNDRNLDVLIHTYTKYGNELSKLNECTNVFDLRNLFDNTEKPIYWDDVHTGPRGNEIIANKFFEISYETVNKIKEEKEQNKFNKPEVATKFNYYTYQLQKIGDKIFSLYNTPQALGLILVEISEKSNEFLKNEEIIENNIKPYEVMHIGQYYKGANLQNTTWHGKNFTNAVFFNANLKNVLFKNSILLNADFRFANIENTVFENVTMKNARMSFSEIITSKFDEVDLSNADFKGVKFQDVEFNNTKFNFIDLSNRDSLKIHWKNSEVIGVNFTNSNLKQVYFDNVNLENSIFDNVNIKNLKVLHCYNNLICE